MKVIDVANFFITVGSYNEGSEMTNARINKLLYFAQGRYLATYGKPLFDEKIEAWKFGPIIEEIYHSFKSYGNNIITKTKGEFDIEEMDDDDFQFLSDVFTNYADYSTSALIDKTHENGSPWSKVYIPNKNVVIPQNLIKKYFSKMPAMRTVSDSLQNIPTIGYINDEGYTVLPKRYDD